MPFSDCSGLKEIHNPFLLASTVTGISVPSSIFCPLVIVDFVVILYYDIYDIVSYCILESAMYSIGKACEKEQNMNIMQRRIASPSVFHLFSLFSFHSSSLHPYSECEGLKSPDC